mmetsp:Transcript_15592/g.35212  ORF Transcript_15592/g.35212 Transcript_15592/m.35212 type:complete len:222 (-) Transcript_15592:179-844(-)
MLRGLWLWLEKGVRAAKSDSILVGSNSSCENSKGNCSGNSCSSSPSPAPPAPLAKPLSCPSCTSFSMACDLMRSSASTDMFMKSCSRAPIVSTLPVRRHFTGRTKRPGPRKRKSPGKSRPPRWMATISSSVGMLSRPRTLHSRSFCSTIFRRLCSMWPKGLPSSSTQTCVFRSKPSIGGIPLSFPLSMLTVLLTTLSALSSSDSPYSALILVCMPMLTSRL